MGFFDFLAEIPPYSEKGAPPRRMNKRHRMIVEPFRDRIAGGRVLDLGAHDGRWAYALAEAGAREVVAVEARAELVERFAAFPESDFKQRVTMQIADLYEYLDGAVAAGERFDTVALYGIFYHVMDHFRILRQIRALGAGLVIVDSEFIKGKNAIIQLVGAKTALDINAAPQIEGQAVAVEGIASFTALERMAGALGFQIEWIDAAALFPSDRMGIQDYFRKTRKIRATCALTPAG